VNAIAESDTFPSSHDQRDTTNRQTIVHYIQRAHSKARKHTQTTYRQRGQTQHSVHTSAN
jgi:hypothetical protein